MKSLLLLLLFPLFLSSQNVSDWSKSDTATFYFVDSSFTFDVGSYGYSYYGDRPGLRLDIPKVTSGYYFMYDEPEIDPVILLIADRHGFVKRVSGHRVTVGEYRNNWATFSNVNRDDGFEVFYLDDKNKVINKQDIIKL